MAKDRTASIVPLKLQGKKVFLAGGFFGHGEDISGLVKLEGGEVVADLTDKTDIVVLGFSGVANLHKKAAKLNAQGAAIQVLTMDQFRLQIRPTPDEAARLLL